MTSEQQVIEAFGLGSALATIGADVKHLVTSFAEIKTSLGGAITDIGNLKTNDARQDEQIRVLMAWQAAHDAAPRPDYITKDDFNALRAEVAGGRLTWPKLFAGLGGIAGIISVTIAWLNAAGAFDRI